MIYASAAAVVIALLALVGFRMWLGVKVAENATERMEELSRETAEKDALRAEAKRVIERMVDTEKRVAALEVVASAPVDLTKHDAAVRNLGVQLKELSDHVEEQFKRERASRAGMLAGPQSRRIVG
jgi:predicted negative regulator of RcsB-dependent stress response